MLNSGTISNPFPEGEDNSFVNGSNERAKDQEDQQQTTERRKKKKKGKGSRRFQLNASSGPNAQEIGEAVNSVGGDDFFPDQDEQLY